MSDVETRITVLAPTLESIATVILYRMTPSVSATRFDCDNLVTNLGTLLSELGAGLVFFAKYVASKTARTGRPLGMPGADQSASASESPRQPARPPIALPLGGGRREAHSKARLFFVRTPRKRALGGAVKISEVVEPESVLAPMPH